MDKEEALLLLQSDRETLRARAEEVTLRNKGRHVFTRGLIEFSNICRRNCLYCGLRAQNKNLERYSLTREQILAAAGRAVNAGMDTIVLQSGEDAVDAYWLADVVAEITNILAVSVTLSVGECQESDYFLWKKAGASRYLIKHETASEELYSRLHPGYTLKQRLNCLRMLKDIGYEIGSGFMIGLPGQTLESIAEDIILCQNLNVDMAGVGPFIPQADTPLSTHKAGSAELTLRVISVLRLAVPGANLPATTALATVDSKYGQQNGLKAGANVLMPNFTPAQFAANYRIYDQKNRVDLRSAVAAIEGCGRSHSIKLSQAEAAE